jgi:chloramphenicol 3-O phosphotransferase
MTTLGQIVLLNGPPRAGKTSIATAIQDRFEGVWMNLGLDNFKSMTPARYQPGIGLRPGGEAPQLEPLVVTLYLAMYESIAAHSRRGVNVVADVGHHDGYSQPLGILPQCARLLDGLPALLVGVRCPIEVIMARRQATWGRSYEPDGSIPRPIRLFQELVHTPGIYDLEVDTSQLSPEQSADAIRRHLDEGPPPGALRRLAGGAGPAA